MDTFAYGTKSRPKRARKSRKVLAGYLAGVTLFGAGLAFAWGNTLLIDSNGTTTGKAKAGQAVVATLQAPTDAEIVGTVFPGDPPSATTMKVTNSGAAPIHVTDVVWDDEESGSISGAEGICTLGSNTGSNGTFDALFNFTAKHGLTAPSIPAGTTQVITIPASFSLDANAPAGCANAVFGLKLNVTLAAGA